MLRRVLGAIVIFLAVQAPAFAVVQPAGGDWPDPLAKLLGSMAHDQWVKLGPAVGADPFSLLQAYGFTACNFSAKRPAGCAGGSGSGDAFQTDEQVHGGAAGAANGPDPLGNVNIFSYTALTIRGSDGKICQVGSGGHFASGTSAGFCFDSIAAAATCDLSTFVCAGVWTMPLKPAKMLRGYDARPAGSAMGGQAHCMASWAANQSSPATIEVSRCADDSGSTTSGPPKGYVQNGATSCFGPNAWVVSASIRSGLGAIRINSPTRCAGTDVAITLNPAYWYAKTPSGGGQLMPPPCHQYYTGIAIPGTTKWTFGGAFCNPLGEAVIGGVVMFDDKTAIIEYPFPSAAVHGYSSGTSGIAYDDLDRCLYSQGGFTLVKWCSPTSRQPKRTAYRAIDGYNQGPFFAPELIIPDPANRRDRALMGLSDFQPGAYYNLCRRTQTFGCFNYWHGLNSGRPQDMLAAWGGLAPFKGSAQPTIGICYDVARGKVLLSGGGKAIYQIDTHGVEPTSDPATSAWRITLAYAGMGGPNNVTPDRSTSSAQGNLGCLQPRYHAEIYVMEQNVFLHKD